MCFQLIVHLVSNFSFLITRVIFMEVIRFPDVPFLSSLDRLFSHLVFVFSLDTVVIAAISLDLSVLHFGQIAVPWSIVSFL